MRAHDKILVAAGFIALFMTAGFVGVYFDTDFLLSHFETSVIFYTSFIEPVYTN